ncbi:ClpP/crotonase [Meira miltonrushii]|uniref:ClpP/crotonase n=1 Tax=Meira miltonrushii TaxID=1280837 RepID=A0A316V622_9BASI|nr:ClpP/crotonase [Meira miltonrushii]PWN32694.1 ClpP/crotonase [Meira miltonrushii]
MSTSKEGWLRTSRYLKTRRPAPRVLLIAISNPPYNLLNGDILYDLKRVLETLSPRETGVVIITSAVHDIFLSHYDLQEILDLTKTVPMGSHISPGVVRGALYVESFLAACGLRRFVERSPLAGLSYLNSFYEVTSLLRSLPQVTIAAINGRALGSGAELALACDFRIMVDTPPQGIPGESRGSGFGHPEITLGLIPGGGGTQVLTNLVGPAKALELSLMKPFLTAEEALQAGLVTRLVKRKDLIPETVDLAIQLAKRAPSAVAAIKDCVYIGASRDFAGGIRNEQGNLGACALVPESRDALAKYTADLETFLGEESTMDQFKTLETGDYVDFIPNSWIMKQDAFVAEQQRELLRKNAKDAKAAGTANAIHRKQKAAGKTA